VEDRRWKTRGERQEMEDKRWKTGGGRREVDDKRWTTRRGRFDLSNLQGKRQIEYVQKHVTDE